MELLWGLSQVVVGSGCVCARVSGGVSLDAVCVCGCLRICWLLNQQYLVFVQIVANYLPPANTSVSCQASGPLCPWEQPGGQCGRAQPQQSHPQRPTSLSHQGEITAQLSPLVLNFPAALTVIRRSCFFDVWQVMPCNNNIIIMILSIVLFPD